MVVKRLAMSSPMSLTMSFFLGTNSYLNEVRRGGEGQGRGNVHWLGLDFRISSAMSFCFSITL